MHLRLDGFRRNCTPTVTLTLPRFALSVQWFSGSRIYLEYFAVIRQRTWQMAEPLYSRISSFFTRHFCSRLRYNYELKWLNLKENTTFLHVLISMPFLLFQFLVPQRYFDVLKFSFYHVVKVGQMSHYTQTRTLIESRSHGCFVLFLCLMSYGPQWSQLIWRARKFLEILLQFGNNFSIVVGTLCLNFETPRRRRAAIPTKCFHVRGQLYFIA